VTSFECILYDVQDHVAVIRLNRPAVLNAMNRQLWLDLGAALAQARRDAEVKVVVLTGEGRAFSTGADLKESRTRSPQAYRGYLETLQEYSRQILLFEKPTLAAINGYAVGSGYELALACDLRLAAEDARIGSPEVTVASSVTGGALRLVQALVGPGKARELLFTGEYIDGREAARIGLVNRAVPGERLMEETLALAAKIAANSALSLKLVKQGLLLAQGECSLAALMAYEVEACLACVSSTDRQEALDRFADRKTGQPER
jgi:enoyl-CoA hydratase